MEVHPDEGADVPDIIMLERSGAQRRTMFAVEAKHVVLQLGVCNVLVVTCCELYTVPALP